MSVTRAVELNTGLYYVESIDTLSAGLGTTHIPSYVRMDAGVIYRPSGTLELSLWGQNLLEPRHAEMSNRNAGMVMEVPRSLFARITKRF
jgi:iron complex outermembrane receptor protein